MLATCAKYCLPIRIHHCACYSSGIRGYQAPPESLRPGAIVVEPGEMRWCKPVDPAKLKSERRG